MPLENLLATLLLVFHVLQQSCARTISLGEWLLPIHVLLLKPLPAFRCHREARVKVWLEDCHVQRMLERPGGPVPQCLAVCNF